MNDLASMIRTAVLLGCLWPTAAAPAQDVRSDPRTRSRELLTKAQRADNRGLLREAAAHLEQLIKEGDTVAVGRAQSLLAVVYLESGRFNEALAAADAARRLLNQPQLADNSALRQYRQDAAVRGADVHLALARIRAEADDDAGAEAQTSRAVELFEQALSVRGGRRLVEPAWELGVLERLARLHTQLNQPRQSAARWEQVAELARQLRDDNAPRQTGEDTIEPVEDYVAAVRALGRYHAARDDMPEAVDALSRLADEPVADELKVALLSDIAALWQAKHNRREEINWLQTAAQLEAACDEPSDRRLANLNGRRAAALDAMEQESAADEFWQTAADHFRRAIDAVDLEESKDEERTVAELMLDMQRLQDVYQRLRQYDNALGVATGLRDLRRQRYLADDPRIFQSQTRIGTYLALLARQDKEKLTEALPPLEEAAAYWDARLPEAPDVHARTLIAMAGVHRRKGDLKKSEQVLETAVERYPAQRLSAPVRMSLAVARGLMLSEQGKYHDAIHAYQQADQIGQALGRQVNELHASALLNLAMVYKSQLQFDEARKHCLLALQERLKVLSVDDQRLLPHYLALGGLNVAAALADTDGTAGALAELKDSVARCESICRSAGLLARPTPDVGTLYQQRAMIHYLESRETASAQQRSLARDAWQQARQIHQETGRPSEEARALYYLAKLSLYDWQDALQAWWDQRRAEEDYRQRQQKFDADVGRLKQQRRRYVQRVVKYERELKSYHGATQRQEATQEDYAELKAEYKRLSQEQSGLAEAKRQLITTHASLDQTKRELDAMFATVGNAADEQLAVAGPLNDALQEVTTAGNMLREMGAFPNLHYLALNLQAEILLHLADVHRGASPADARQYENQAVLALELAVDLTDTPRSGVTGGDMARAEFFSNYVTAFDLLVRLHAGRGRSYAEAGQHDTAREHFLEALYFAEKGRNRTFLDQLRAAEVDIRETIPAENRDLLTREEALLLLHGETQTRANDVAHRLAQAAEPDQIARLEAEQQVVTDQLRQLREQYAGLLGAIYDASPQYSRLLRTTNTQAELAAALSTLATDRGPLLYYYVGREESHLFLVHAAGEQIEYFPLVPPRGPDAETLGLSNRVPAALLKSEVQRYRNLLSDSSRSGQLLRGGLVAPKTSTVTGKPLMSYVALAEMIMPAVVRRRVADLSPDYVTVVPDGALHNLPLEALRTQAAPNTRFLLDDFPAIAYAPSITILKALVDYPSPARPAPTALTLGNPAFSTDPPPTPDDVPPLLAANNSASADDSTPRFAAAGVPLRQLPHAEKEAQQLEAMFVDAFGRANVVPLVGDVATEARLRQELHDRPPTFLHLATHGFVDDKAYNLFGSIALAASPTRLADPRNDSYLSLHEIHDLPLAGCELAVLSACQTNVGPVRPLESGSTLARAFLSAGARRVISSQWQVADDSTAVLIVDCVQRITDNFNRPHGIGNYAISLQTARLRIRNSGQWSSPYHWAPFVLVGPAD